MRARRGAAVVRRVLDPRRARSAWVRAHQLERLALPALRPVRLSGPTVELLLPPGSSDAPPDPLDIRVATHKLAACGSFVAAPEWLAADGGAWLTNPEVFEVRS